MWQLGQLAAHLGLELDAQYQNLPIGRIAPLHLAQAGDISFVSDVKYLAQLANTRASAVIVPPTAQDLTKNAIALVHPKPYLAYAQLSALFAPSAPENRIHPSAVIDQSARIGTNTVVGAGAVIESGAVVGSDCVIGARVFIGRDCQVGDRVNIQAGAVIGADGFGYADGGEKWHKIHQLGAVVIGNDVEIGANTCIDRGALENTVIGDKVILDNLIQIAHNVTIGEKTAIAAMTGIAGSAKIGAHCSIGGGVRIKGHLEICDHCHIAANTFITNSLKTAGAYGGGMLAMDSLVDWRKNMVRFKALDQLFRRVKKLENHKGD